MKNKNFWIFLIILFVAIYWWAGGAAIVDKVQPGANMKEPSEITGYWERFYRIIAIKNQVRAKINTQDYTRLQDIPLTMQQAIIAVEDNRFYSHYGFDIEGILRATLVNMQTGTVQEGASTITQQLVKNLFLTSDKTWGRKAEEFILAIDLEQRYSKEEILEIYLNTIYFGSGAQGITQASKVYFDKSPAELTLAESAMLAGLPNAPSVYSPYISFTAAKQRQAVVLAAMVRYNYIGPGLAQEAKNSPIVLAR